MVAPRFIDKVGLLYTAARSCSISEEMYAGHWRVKWIHRKGQTENCLESKEQVIVSSIVDTDGGCE